MHHKRKNRTNHRRQHGGIGFIRFGGYVDPSGEMKGDARASKGLPGASWGLDPFVGLGPDPRLTPGSAHAIRIMSVTLTRRKFNDYKGLHTD